MEKKFEKRRYRSAWIKKGRAGTGRRVDHRNSKRSAKNCAKIQVARDDR